jgi:SulP family sulfate permease
MNAQAITRNTLAGITTSLAMVPEVVAFAILAHVNPLVGLYAAVVLGLVTALFGGRPGLISGGAGSLAVVSVALVVTHGVEYLFACIILMGVIQFAFGAFKLGRLIKLVSPSVMTGFVN